MTFKIGRDSNGVIAYSRNLPKQTLCASLAAGVNATVQIPEWAKTAIFSSTGDGVHVGIREGNADISVPTGTFSEIAGVMDPSAINVENLGGITLNILATAAETVSIDFYE